MSQAKIVITDYIEDNLDWEVEEMAKRDIDFSHHQLKLAPQDELVSVIRDCDVVIVNMAPMPEEVIAQLEKCKLIIRHGIGYDNVDTDACTKYGIRLANVPDYCAQEVSEQALALILSCTRRLFESRRILEEASASGIWDFSTLGAIHRMSDQTLGIVGAGRIGSRIFRMTENIFGRRMICDPYMDDRRIAALGVEERYTLEDVLSEADVVTIHTPLNEETRYLIDEPQLKMMKESAFLVNTARGAIVNTEALTKALKEGWIAGAGIDVYETEPPPADMELFDLPEATLSAHLGWMSEEAGWDIRYKIMQDVDLFLQGEPPRFTVNPEVEAKLDGAYREV
ncbi:MAG: C-terminal binding protein [candidate division WS1 bacterium]|jgi:D-3-phosphoglycerate dehydrogenase|nr:C-terminal binding protein [candidate division WS1 bacterium]